MASDHLSVGNKQIVAKTEEGLRKEIADAIISEARVRRLLSHKTYAIVIAVVALVAAYTVDADKMQRGTTEEFPMATTIIAGAIALFALCVRRIFGIRKEQNTENAHEHPLEFNAILDRIHEKVKVKSGFDPDNDAYAEMKKDYIGMDQGSHQ